MENLNAADCENVFNKLSDNTKHTIDSFLQYYKESTFTQYRPAIISMIYHLGISNIKSFTYNEYIQAIKMWGIKSERNTTSNAGRYKFIQYVFAFDIINTSSGFTWDKSKIIKDMERLKRKYQNDSQNKPIEPYKPVLSFHQVEKLKSFIDIIDFHDKSSRRLSFLCYMLFYTDCPSRDIRYIELVDYNGGLLYGKYNIPERYRPIFEGNFRGFSSQDELIRKVGKLLGIEDLKPSDIQLARTQNLFMCSECGNSYFNDIKNWVAVNGKIICYKCFETLKKNKYNVIAMELISSNIDIIENDNDVGIIEVTSSYDKFKDKLLHTKFDYVSYEKYVETVGALGEKYVLKQEKNKLSGTQYFDMVDNSLADDPQNGYDILSYSLDGTEIHIEVKTEAHDTDNDFYLTDHELQTAKSMKKSKKVYLIYRVHNILEKDENKVWHEVISNIDDDSRYVLKPHVYKVSTKRD